MKVFVAQVKDTHFDCACVGGWGGEYNIMSKCNFKLYTVGMHTQKT